MRVEDYHRRGHRARHMLYRAVAEGRARLRDPQPPRSLAEYLSRPDYSLWIWTGAALTLLWAALDGLAAPPIILAPLGILVVLLLPGYYTLHALRPQKGMRPIEELALSVGLSLTILPLEALALSLTLGFTRETFIVTHTLYLLAASLAAAHRSWEAVETGGGG